MGVNPIPPSRRRHRRPRPAALARPQPISGSLSAPPFLVSSTPPRFNLIGRPARGRTNERAAGGAPVAAAAAGGGGGPAEAGTMNGSGAGGTAAASPKTTEEQVGSGHGEKENNPFAEYMWMENEEDFNRQVEEELQEQEFLDRCFQEMLEEEDQDWFIPSRDLPQQQLNGLSVANGHASEDILSKSNLNPDAKEFVPGVKY
ncbi:polyadenylate-binding protein-interacting protein 2B [Mergus octosetaceus]